MPIRLSEIRSHEGSQARAWEELAYQLRPPVSSGHAETRKTRAPDAGVEWYEVYADGHTEGFQAKFHASLADALSGMKESVLAVCEKRPELTRLTFVVPYDFTDSGAGKTKTDQDRWDDAVAGWQRTVEGADKIEFRTIRAGDVLAQLATSRNAGRCAFWFGHFELSPEWFEKQVAETVAVVGDRYTPTADTDVIANSAVEAAAAGNRFLNSLRSLIDIALYAGRRDTGMWGSTSGRAAELLNQLAEFRAVLTEGVAATGSRLSTSDFDVKSGCQVVDDLLTCAAEAATQLDQFNDRPLRHASEKLHELRELLGSRVSEAYTSRTLALVGTAGSGKTHALVRAAVELQLEGSPVIVIVGQRLGDAAWWPEFKAVLGVEAQSAEVFLQELDSLAEARGRRAVLLVDALNESQEPRRWRTELKALLAQSKMYPNVAVVVSYRSDYSSVIEPPGSLPVITHGGFVGREGQALAAYCRVFGVPVPARSSFDPAFSSPLFLRMFCEVLAADGPGAAESLTRSTLFGRFATVRAARVIDALRLAPSSNVVADAMVLLADKLLAAGGRPISRADVESAVDMLLPSRHWPDTLFGRMHSEGLIEIRPSFSGEESVTLPFQAYSEHVLANRLLDSLGGPSELADSVCDVPWLWRALAVLLPERHSVELVDLLPDVTANHRLNEAVRDGLLDRTVEAFGERAFELLENRIFGEFDERVDGVDIMIALGPRLGHPANARWLHERLRAQVLAERDASWSVAAYTADEYSPSLARLQSWAPRIGQEVGTDEAELSAITLMWLLTSPNRFLRDKVTRTLTGLLSKRLSVAARLITLAVEVDDPYLQERVLLSCYGALMIAGDSDRDGSAGTIDALSSWLLTGLPVHVLARDSARGMAAWAEARGILTKEEKRAFDPPYGAAPPEEPPTAKELKAAHGCLKDAFGTFTDWRANTILMSCLTWMGDFNKYVVRSDVGSFSRYPLSGARPPRKHGDPLGSVEADWAGRWIANRAIGHGWTAERFAEFERENRSDRGREGHKPERFGKKYQWLALHELLARLADNYHLAREPWSADEERYEGPWAWYGRDLDPSIPPRAATDPPQHLVLTHAPDGTWALLPSPALDAAGTPDSWVAETADLASARQVFMPTDRAGRNWIALQRYSTWGRDNAQRIGMTKRERDVFYLQFSWLVPRGDGLGLLDLFREHGLSGRWMDDHSRTHGRYLGELAWSPVAKAVAATETVEYRHERLVEAGLAPRPAVEKYLWEGNVLDCSIDESIDFYVPADEVLGSAAWDGVGARWAEGGTTVAQAVEVPDAESGQVVLLAESEWLRQRLADLDCDLVIGVLGERHALPMDDHDYRKMAFSDFWYGAVVGSEPISDELVGPILDIRRSVDDR
ncbi:hypothetical protein ACFRCR_02940 [Oerskovia sp. NPDC056781]|uniref:hypothetical protein n=1 Tax=Oerskovia sp. NPDC056781 TaxID=3345942 RepID=UPI003671B3DA